MANLDLPSMVGCEVGFQRVEGSDGSQSASISNSEMDGSFRMGRRQAVRHRSLEPAFGGSNPPAPVSPFTLLRVCVILALSIRGKG